MQKTNVKNKQL